jgi:hypothetical protein
MAADRAIVPIVKDELGAEGAQNSLGVTIVQVGSDSSNLSGPASPESFFASQFGCIVGGSGASEFVQLKKTSGWDYRIENYVVSTTDQGLVGANQGLISQSPANGEIMTRVERPSSVISFDTQADRQGSIAQSMDPMQALYKSIETKLLTVLNEGDYSLSRGTHGDSSPIECVVGGAKIVMEYRAGRQSPFAVLSGGNGPEGFLALLDCNDSEADIEGSFIKIARSSFREKVFREVCESVNNSLRDGDQFRMDRSPRGGGWVLINDKLNSVSYRLTSKDPDAITVVAHKIANKRYEEVFNSTCSLKDLRSVLGQAIKLVNPLEAASSSQDASLKNGRISGFFKKLSDLFSKKF